MKKLSEIKIKPNNASQVHSHAHKINGHLVPVPRRTCALQGHCSSKRETVIEILKIWQEVIVINLTLRSPRKYP